MNATRAIYVINLEHRTDRRIAMEKQLLRIGWRAEFFRAIRPDNAADFPSIGARGCFLSHLSVLRNAQKAGVQQLVILEDDLNFAPKFVERWNLSMSSLETKTWSIFYPGHTLKGLPAGLSRISPNSYAHKRVREDVISSWRASAWGAHAYRWGIFNTSNPESFVGNVCQFSGAGLSTFIAHRRWKFEMV
jgi:GR25 family glycosyltransferase involved in LPS biosynthesis